MTGTLFITPRPRYQFVGVMRDPRWLRSGFAPFVAAAVGVCATLGACDDSGDGNGATPDAGLPDVKPADTGQTVPQSGPRVRLTFVNAAHDLGPSSSIGGNAAVRLCFKVGSTTQNLTVPPYPPIPDTRVASNPLGLRGIACGAGERLSTAGLNLAGRVVVPIVMNARSLLLRGLDNVGANGQFRTCQELIGDRQDPAVHLVENADYWVLPQVETGALADENAYVVALTGCVGDTVTPNPGKCGVGFVSGGGPGVGNLKLTVYETSQSPVAAPFGAQFLHLSTQANAFFSQANARTAIQPGFVSDAAGGADFRPITAVNPAVGALDRIVPVANVTSFDSFVLGPKSLDPFEAATLLPSSLLAIQNDSGLVGPTQPTAYANGRNYVFIAIGDPDTGETRRFLNPDGTPSDGGAGTRFNPRFFHFLAYPTDPTDSP